MTLAGPTASNNITSPQLGACRGVCDATLAKADVYHQSLASGKHAGLPKT
jgi:hypothetical protein